MGECVCTCVFENLLFSTNQFHPKWNETKLLNKTTELMDVWPFSRLNWCTRSQRASILDGTCDHLICEKWTANAKHRVEPHHLRRRRRRRWRWRDKKNIQRKTFAELYLCVSLSVFGCFSSGISFNRSFFFCCRHSRICFMVTLTADQRRCGAVDV